MPGPVQRERGRKHQADGRGTASDPRCGARGRRDRIVAEDANRVREVLGPVYRALELEWDPASAGAVADVATGATPGTIREALVEELRTTHAPERARFDAATLARADELMSWHEPAGDRSKEAHSPLGTKTVAVGPAPD
ncbi:MAG: hypothetical protein JRH17_07690 [Deltaproteobacteria bacterium]|nr:hypothetical protein [Deltaproteobacteria bacterium]